MNGFALLINPWIYDFAAYDLWAFPLGLLYLSSILKKAGWEMQYLDCTNRHHPSLKDKIPREKPFHQGRYYDIRVEKPKVLEFVRRYYKRYGIPEEVFICDLENCEKPDIILVTSRMTYWYPGVKRAIELVRTVFPDTPIILGGIYATLCPDHARKVCKPDVLFTGEAESQIGTLVTEITGIPCKTDVETVINSPNLDSLPFPDYEILPNANALPLETSRGCPYQCTYCASRKMIPRYRRKSPVRIANEIQYAVEKLNTEDFAFYDDALLFEPERHFEKIADKVLRRNIQARYHTPNSIFAHEITPSVAKKMKEMGFCTIRISLETANERRLAEMKRDFGAHHFQTAMKNLLDAGFERQEIGVYIMAGFPGQDAGEVKETIDHVIDAGAIPHIAEYSPIPGTPEFEHAARSAIKDISREPLLHNNSVFHLISGSFTHNILDDLKHYITERTRSLEDNKSQ